MAKTGKRKAARWEPVKPPYYEQPKVEITRARDREQFEIGLRLIQRGGDLSARLMLLDWADEVFDERRAEAALYLHAVFYLEDRTAYELCPPPNRNALPLSFVKGEAYTRQAEAVLGLRRKAGL